MNAAPTRTCGSCGKTISTGSSFCSRCGAAVPATLDPGRKFCTRCGAQHPIDAQFCQMCGVPFKVKAAPVVPAGGKPAGPEPVGRPSPEAGAVRVPAVPPGSQKPEGARPLPGTAPRPAASPEPGRPIAPARPPVKLVQPASPAAPPPAPLGRPHSIALAVLASIVPGAGQAYNGQPFKALLFFLTAPLLIPWIIAFFDARAKAARIVAQGGRHGRGGFAWIILQCWLAINATLLVMVVLTLTGVLR